MGRKRGAVWMHFDYAEDNPSEFKTKRARCKHCEGTVSGATKNLRTHLSNCRRVPRDNGVLNAILPKRTNPDAFHNISQPARGSSGEVCPLPNNTPVESQINPIYDDAIVEDNKKLDKALARAMHQTGTPFHFFDHPSWYQFFSCIKPTWKVPSPSMVEGRLLDEEYKTVMETTRDAIRKAGGGILSIVAFTATSSSLSSRCTLSDAIIHTPLPFFIETLHSDFKREPTLEAAEKISDSVKRIDDMLGFQCISAFVSDSCIAMRSVRQRMLDQQVVRWAYGCVSDGLHSYCENIGKHCFTDTIKDALFVCKSIRATHRVRQLFEGVCVRELNQVYELVLFSKTQWASVNLMLKRLLTVKNALVHLGSAVYVDQGSFALDPTIHLPIPLTTLINSQSFWDSVTHVYRCLNPIFKCIRICDSESATMSTAFACLIYVRIQIAQAEYFDSNTKEALDSAFLTQCQHILSPIHSLAYFCDPYYANMRAQVIEKFRGSFVDLSGVSIIEQCHRSLRLLSDSEEHHVKLMGEFMEYSVNPDPLLAELSKWHPRLIWGQAQHLYPSLSRVLCNVFRAPASIVRIRRNRSTGKRFYSSEWAHMREQKVERQLAIAHNSQQLRRSLPSQRNSDLDKSVTEVCDNEQIASDNESGNEEDFAPEVYEYLSESAIDIERAISTALNPFDIPDDIIFNVQR